jgi:RNA methyltransferase, TrmH family
MLDRARAVTGRTNPLVSRFRRARSAEDGEVLLEGATLVLDALRAGWPVRVVALTETAASRADGASLLRALPDATELVRVPPHVMEALSPTQTPSGTVALASVPPSRDVFARRPALLVCAVDVQDPGNLGAIVRAAEAAGATGVLACGTSADPFGWKALRGAMGSAFRLPVTRRLTIDDALDATRRAGVRLLATMLDGTPVHDVDLRGDVALFVGAEGSGLPRSVIEAADAQVTVPMEAPVESLNVAVATAVTLYEARRQRRAAR